MNPAALVIPVACGCGRQLQARLHCARPGRGRYIAACDTCGRLLRRRFPERTLDLNFKCEQLDAIRVGAPFLWSSEQGHAAEANGLASAYRIQGMPPRTTANLIREAGRGYWIFVIHAQRQSVHSEWSCPSKEEALADLRAWLQSRCSS